MVELSLWQRFRKSNIFILFITSFWLSVIFTYLLPMVAILPLAVIPKVGWSAYRKVLRVYDVYWGRWACLCIPASNCGLRVFFQTPGFNLLDEQKSRGNGLLLSTHGSRIDWLIGVFVGMVPNHQVLVGFVAEVTTALMVRTALAPFSFLMIWSDMHDEG
jgi:hypothetical protein